MNVGSLDESTISSGDLSVVELRSPPDDFLQDEPEGAAFHKAFLASGIAGFDCRYLAIFRGAQRIAVVPYFLDEISLDTMLQDGLVKRCLPKVKIRIACVGHPSSDFGMIDGEISADTLAVVNATLEQQAALVAYKGFTSELPLPGFVRVCGLPVAVLDIGGDYYSGLDARRRNDFRHKLERANALRFEECSELPEHLLPQVFQLYLNTYNRAPLRFERLTQDYFRQTAGISKFLLFFEADTLIGFAQIIGKGSKASFKYVGMDYLRSREYGLYYVMCLKGVEACLRDGYRRLELGVTSYHFKHLLGGQLVATDIYYRHNDPRLNWLLGKLKFLLEPSAAELR